MVSQITTAAYMGSKEDSSYNWLVWKWSCQYTLSLSRYKHIYYHFQSFHAYTFESFRAIKNFKEYMTYLLTLKPISFIMPGHKQHNNYNTLIACGFSNLLMLFSTNSFLFNFFPSWPAANLKLFLLLLKVKRIRQKKSAKQDQENFYNNYIIVSETNTSN